MDRQPRSFHCSFVFYSILAIAAIAVSIYCTHDAVEPLKLVEEYNDLFHKVEEDVAIIGVPATTATTATPATAATTATAAAAATMATMATTATTETKLTIKIPNSKTAVTAKDVLAEDVKKLNAEAKLLRSHIGDLQRGYLSVFVIYGVGVFTIIFLICTLLPYMGDTLTVVRVISYAMFCQFPMDEDVKDAVVNDVVK